MRKTNFAAILAATLVTGSIWANPPKKVSKEKPLSEQIHNILSENTIDVRDTDLTARVLFTLDEEKRITILTIRSDHWDVEGFVRRGLDKKKVTISDFVVGEKYVVDVRLTS